MHNEKQFKREAKAKSREAKLKIRKQKKDRLIAEGVLPAEEENAPQGIIIQSEVISGNGTVPGFGFSHKPSASVWKTMLKNAYLDRMCNALDLFEIPRGIKSVADIGCGPWAGIFFARRWPIMYGVDPSWTVYARLNMLSKVPNMSRFKKIQAYAQNFILPEPVDAMFSINAVNHGGDLTMSMHNMLRNIRSGGLLFFHVHMRAEHKLDQGHPMPLTREIIDNAVATGGGSYISCETFPYDPVRNKEVRSGLGHDTLVATIRREES